MLQADNMTPTVTCETGGIMKRPSLSAIELSV